jgi:hypothetical protein
MQLHDIARREHRRNMPVLGNDATTHQPDPWPPSLAHFSDSSQVLYDALQAFAGNEPSLAALPSFDNPCPPGGNPEKENEYHGKRQSASGEVYMILPSMIGSRSLQAY